VRQKRACFREDMTMNEYEDRINESGLPTITKAMLKQLLLFVQWHQELKEKQVTPEQWIEDIFLKYGI
jgi:hypothetical protein